MIPVIFLSAFLLFLLWTPYSLFHSVQLAYFLHPIHAADSSFLARDWYTSQTAAPHPFFSALIEWLVRHQCLETGLFLIHLLQLALLLWGLLRLARLFSDDWRVSLLTVFFIFFYFSDGLAQSALYSPIVQAADLAVPFYLFSLVFLFEKRILLSCILLAASGLFHIHYAVNGALVFILFMCLDRRGIKLKTYGAGLFIFAILVLPGMLPLLHNFSFTEPMHDPSIFKLFFYFRSPHHYAPAAFELSHTFRVLFPLLFLVVTPKSETAKSAGIYTLILLALCLLAAFSVQPFYFPAVARLFFFRLSPMLLVLGLIFMSIWFSNAFSSQDRGYKVLSLILMICCLLEKDARLFVLLASYLFICILFHERLKAKIKERLLILLYSLPIVFFFLLTSRISTLFLNCMLSVGVLYLLNRRPVNAASKILIIAAVLWIPALARHLYQPEKHPWYFPEVKPAMEITKLDPALFEVCQRIDALTPPNALLITPPYLDGIRFYAQRAIVVDLHGNPYGSEELRQWRKRLETVSQTSLLENGQLTVPADIPAKTFLRRAYLRLDADQVKAIARQYKAGYFLTETGAPAVNELLARGHKLLAQNSSYCLFRLNEEPR